MALPSDIGLNPWGVDRKESRPALGNTAGLKYGHVVLYDTASAGVGKAVISTTSAGAGPVAGVVSSQCDPTSGAAVGDVLELCTNGVVEVLLAASQTIVKGDKLITSTTAGAAKKLAAETGSEIVFAVATMDATTGVGETRLISAKLYGPALSVA